jgi:hypothetical protein
LQSGFAKKLCGYRPARAPPDHRLGALRPRDLSPAQIERFVARPVTLAVDHPAYAKETVLGDDTLAELRHDLWLGG